MNGFLVGLDEKMKKTLKDPKQTLLFLFRMSLVTLIFLPIIYININKIDRLIIILISYIVITLLIKIFYPKKEEYILQNIAGAGYAFSAIWFIIALVIVAVIGSDYFKLNVFPPTGALIGSGALLFFSFILYYFADKSRAYEKK